MRKTLTLAGMPLALAAGVLVGRTASPAPYPPTRTVAAVTAAQACPRMTQPVRQCVITPPGGYGTLNIAAAGADPGTPWIAADPGGAPMAWVNLYGLYSGGDGGKEPGGLICVTYGVVASIACLTPQGTLILQPTGPNGPTGRPQVFTARDIAWIHAHGG